MFYRQPQISDALILVALVALNAVELYFQREREKDPVIDAELQEIAREAEIERLKFQAEDMRRRNALESARRDEEAAGGKSDKQFVF